MYEVFVEALLGDTAQGDDGDSDDDGESLLDQFTGLLAMLYPKTQTVVTTIDVSDRSDPRLVSETAFEGDLASSRMIDGVLRLVVASEPDDYYGILPLGMPEVDGLLDLMNLDDLTPDYETTTVDGQVTRGNMIGWDGFYRPTDPDGFGVLAVIRRRK